MGKYIISNHGNARPYLSIEPEDEDAIRGILVRLDVACLRSSKIKDGVNGYVYFDFINIDEMKCELLQAELNKQFP